MRVCGSKPETNWTKNDGKRETVYVFHWDKNYLGRVSQVMFEI